MRYDWVPKGENGRRIASRLVALKDQLADEDKVPHKNFKTLLLATWNIREFDSRSYGTRRREAILYIAEIISHFDIVAIQEVRRDLKALERLQRILGNWWDYIVTDVTEGSHGNKERMAFIYDRRKVSFGGVAGEVVIKPVRKTSSIGKKIEFVPAKQLARTPFICGFHSGWSKFMLCTVHILYGKAIKAPKNRVEEIRNISRFLAKRSKDELSWSRNIILLGDFNIFDPSDITMKQIDDAGFTIPEELQSLRGTSVGKRKRKYDQIAFLLQGKYLNPTKEAGVIDYYKSVYRNEDEEVYEKEMGQAYQVSSKGTPRDATGKKQYYRTHWRTHQMSDHLPMWIELKIDFGKEYLKEKAAE